MVAPTSTPAAPPQDGTAALDLDLVTLDEIRDAATMIKGVAVRTPLLASPWPGLWLKPESLQPIGAFKIRGALTAMSLLSPEVRARGVVAHSSGNHAQAVAYAARFYGVGAHIVIPQNAPATKIEATKALGATVELVLDTERVSRSTEIAAETGMTMIPPYDDRNVIAGQGTIGLEIAQDCADGLVPDGITTVLVPVSGGGLISGIAAALTALMPQVRVIGVEPELAGDAAESLQAGELRVWAPADAGRTVADGLRAFSVGVLPWEHIRTQVADIITVSEAEILDATRQLTLRARLVTEPSGAVATAAFLHHADRLPPGNAVAILTGGNIEPALLRTVLGDIEPRRPAAGAR